MQVNLETKSGPELVAIFNGIEGVSPVKRFRTREAGIKRIITTKGYITTDVEDMSSAANVRPDKGLTKLANEIVVSTPKVRGVYNLDRKELIRTFRPNSRRGRLITLLLGEGATFDQLLANSEVGFNTEDVLHKTIRILNWWTGYGISTDENGTITLTS